jgi:hypothetical protein
MYKLEKVSIIDKDNTYKDVISISPSPKIEALKKISKRYSNNKKLSIFKTEYAGCLELLLNPTDMSEYINTNNIEFLISYLIDNSITINYQLTELMQKTNPDLLFYIS